MRFRREEAGGEVFGVKDMVECVISIFCVPCIIH